MSKICLFLKICGTISVLTVILVLGGCSGNPFADKYEGIWVSENVLYYDYSKYKYDVFPLEKLPDDLFTERYIEVVKIEKKDKSYEVTVSGYHLGAINRDAGNYVGQLNELKKYDDRSLVQGTYDSNPIIEGNMLTVKDERGSTIVRTVKEGKRTRELRDDVHDRYVFVCENGILRIKDHYFEALNGNRIDIPQDDIKYTAQKSFKKMSSDEFNRFCDDMWKKSIDAAQKMQR